MYGEDTEYTRSELMSGSQVWRAHRVDHRIKYIPALANTLNATYAQNITSMVCSSQSPTLGTPYSQMLINMTANLLHISEWASGSNRAVDTDETNCD